MDVELPRQILNRNVSVNSKRALPRQIVPEGCDRGWKLQTFNIQG